MAENDNDIAAEAKAVAPKRSGKLAGSVRGSKAKNRVTVSAGGARAPYAPYVAFGSVHNPNPIKFLYIALDSVDAASMIEKAVADAIRRAGL